MAQARTFYWLKVYESYLLKVPHLTGTLNEPARLGSMSQQNLKAEASKIQINLDSGQSQIQHSQRKAIHPAASESQGGALM